ncbi:hypothetical protein ACIBTV_29830 [Micromonospora sp. NPDC049366]|uniref:hypothetical protein n=1 Tax=Micromonospora sp. NPDC049366 TaxID=3364271 RepID=UPI0037A6AF6A
MRSARAGVGGLRVGLMLPLLGVAALLGPLPMATAVLAGAPQSAEAPGRAGSPAPTASVAADAGQTRYYVVAAPRDGQREYLYQIAVQTLGDGNRYREIFELNRGRPQPDGGRLTDPLAALQPGWVLELPADADGEAVRVGPLPMPSAAPSAGPTTVGNGTSATPYLVGGGLLVVAVLLAAGLWLHRTRRRTHKPAPAPGLAAETSSKVDSAPAEPATVPTETVAVPAETVAVPAETVAVPAETVAVPAETVTVPAEPVVVRAEAAAAPAETVAAPVETVVDPAGTRQVVPAQPVAAMGESGRVIVVLDSLAGDPPDRLDVRLIGVAAGAARGVPCAWVRDESLADATLPFVLGRQGGRRFVADLAATPDILTITGTPTAARRQARAMAEQLRAAGLAVTVVGDLLGADLPHGCRRLATFPTAEPEIAALAGPGVILSGGLSGVELTTARGLAARTGRHVVPVLVGEVMRTRWSVRATEPKP